MPHEVHVGHAAEAAHPARGAGGPGQGHQRRVEVGAHGHVALAAHPHLAGHRVAQQRQHALVVAGGRRASVQLEAALAGQHVAARAAVDHRALQRGRAQQRVGLGATLQVEGVDGRDVPRRQVDGVDAFPRAAGVARAAGDHHLGAQQAALAGAHVEAGGLAHHRRVEGRQVAHAGLEPLAAGLLVADQGQHQPAGERVAVEGRRGHGHGGHRRLGVVGAAPEHLAVLQRRVPGVAGPALADGHHVGVRAQQQPTVVGRLRRAALDHGHHVAAVGPGLDPVARQPGEQVVAAVGLVSRHAGDVHQRCGEVDRVCLQIESHGDNLRP